MDAYSSAAEPPPQPKSWKTYGALYLADMTVVSVALPGAQVQVPTIIFEGKLPFAAVPEGYTPTAAARHTPIHES